MEAKLLVLHTAGQYINPLPSPIFSPSTPTHTSYNTSIMARQRRSAPVRSQSRSAHTAAAPAAAPPQAHYPPAVSQPQASQGPGLFANMASTAAGVAVGSTIGHTLGAGITGMFSGGSSSAPVEQQQVAQSQQYQQQAKTCDGDARTFTRCLEENGGDMQICGYYLQQLKACQEAARQY
ncbi:hypothetical protein PUMCH_001194 [Australozyma saopauloensis]|uniref:Mitochondrial intermembrane space cysteine motif-containing protein MIX17 n=1 Tax=Australozyma saopauloensis TaxID=291208 RepID=A0AAX4H629_9ASCO|nr:hypothetical protein PUMCH_001194 [[Candida] saopauloensis]